MAETLMPSDSETLRKNALRVVPEAYHDFLDVFSKHESDKLPPRRPCDHKIELTKGLTQKSSSDTPDSERCP